MVNETTTIEEPRDTAPTTHTTVIREGGSSGITGIVMAMILLVAIIGGIYLFSLSNSTEAAKDNAITNAANSVGNAADKVGDAAQNASDNMSGGSSQ
jgi:hypothetical protein